MVLSHFKREWGNESIYRRPFFYFRQISSPFEYQCGHEHGRTQRTSQPEIRGHPPWNATGNRGTVEQSSWCFRDICIYEPIFGREIWNVAIPFSSGHHSYASGEMRSCSALSSRNPFFIRSSFLRAERPGNRKSTSRNPFFIRSSFLPWKKNVNSLLVVGRNPFFIRSSFLRNR